MEFAVLTNHKLPYERIMLQVFDVFGSQVELRNHIIAGSIIQSGDLYRSGAYYLKVQRAISTKKLN